MPAYPQFTATPKIGAAALTTADAALSGAPAQVQTILTAGANGTRVDQVVVVGTTAGAQAAAVVRLWLYDGANYHLFDEIALAAVTQSATVAAQRAVNAYSNLVVPSGWSLRCTTSVTQGYKVTAFGGDY